MPPVPPEPPRYAQTFTVQYTDEKCKKYAIDVLNVIDGIVAENDKKSGLARDVCVSVTRRRDLEATEKILKLFGSSVHKKSVFKGTFEGNKKGNALSEVKKLKGVVDAEWERVKKNASTYLNAPSTLIVLGNADPGIVLTTLRKYGTDCISG